jgi:cytochrome c556
LKVKIKGFVFVVSALAAIALNGHAQTERRFDDIMKEVGSTFAELKENLDKQNPDAAKHSLKLQGLFKEVEAFWARYDTKDAIDAAQKAQTAFGALSESVRVNNFQQAGTTYTAAGRYCAACHSVHRVQAADQSYLIKP